MGTSSAFKGPNGKNPLLPDDYSDKWKDLKSEMSQMITGKRINSTGRILSKYVVANGGTAGLTNRMQSGSTTLGNFIGVLRSIEESGVLQTFEKFQVNHSSTNIVSAFSELANYISPEGDYKEDTVAREATIKAFSKLYDILEEREIPLDQPLSEYSESFVFHCIEVFTTELVFAQLLTDLGNSFEKYGDDVEATMEKEKDIYKFITASVRVSIEKTGLNGDPNIIAKNVLKTCFDIFFEE